MGSKAKFGNLTKEQRAQLNGTQSASKTISSRFNSKR